MSEPSPNTSTAALTDADVDRVLRLIEEAGDVHPDLREVLSEADPDRVIDNVFRDEVHARRT